MLSLPSYVEAAKPVPAANGAAWYKNVAPTYAGIMLWFVFWQDIVTGGEKNHPPEGILSQGVWTALFGVVIAALICHFLFYLVPGLLGQKTGLPLYVVGTSTYGVTGRAVYARFLMGLLQFGWLAVNACGVAKILCGCLNLWKPELDISLNPPSLYHAVIATAFAVICGFVGLKGIQYVAKVATYLPLIPLAVLILLVVKTAGGLDTFQPSDISPLENAPRSARPTRPTPRRPTTPRPRPPRPNRCPTWAPGASSRCCARILSGSSPRPAPPGPTSPRTAAAVPTCNGAACSASPWQPLSPAAWPSSSLRAPTARAWSRKARPRRATSIRSN